jgi:hypothetical protein
VGACAPVAGAGSGGKGGIEEKEARLFLFEEKEARLFLFEVRGSLFCLVWFFDDQAL